MPLGYGPRMKTLLLVLVAFAGVARAEVPLIPRDVLSGNPEKISPKLSPDGKRIAWLQPDKQNVLQVWVKTVGGSDEKIVTADKKRGIRQYFWAENNKHLLYMQDADGDENFHVYGVDLDANQVRDFTPWQGVRASAEEPNPKFPNTLLVNANVRDKKLMDVWRVDLTTGAAVLDTTNPGDVVGWLADPSFVVRAAQVSTKDGGTELRWRTDAKAAWKTLLKVGPEEDLDLIDFTADGKSVFLKSSIGKDTARLVERNLATGKEKELIAHPEVDLGDAFVHPTRHVVQAVQFDTGRREWKVLDPSVKNDFDAIGKLAPGDFFVINRDSADQNWLVVFTYDRGPSKFYAWDRKAQKGTFLFVHQSKLEGLQLAEMKPVVIPSRDGLKLHGYLTLPAGAPAQKLPLVLMVHGGPWGRDTWGFQSTTQWLANRGYAVLQVNFRGSTGFGKKFLHAGDRQWGKKMHDDLLDAVDWAVKQGTADPKRVAIYGGSYGGYAALAGAAFTPDVFKCAVDIVGPSNLTTLIHSIPPYWAPMRAVFDVRVGNVDDPKDAQMIKDASPLFSAHKIKIPLLIGQGANDPRVKQAESEQIVGAIEKNGGHATYVVYPDEGHGFARPENRIDFNARAEKFLADTLGGRYEKLTGDKVPGSTAVVKVIAPKKK
jgi:dipeptidyl aminopeptidase/acylaminoacyl peptidase